MGQTQTNIKARTHSIHSLWWGVNCVAKTWFILAWLYFLWTIFKVWQTLLLYENEFLANQGSFESKEKLSKVEVFILTWVCVRTWSVPVSGTHLGRVGICQWLYSVYSDCTATVLHSTVRDIRRGQCPLRPSSLTVHCPGPGVTREKSLQRINVN